MTPRIAILLVCSSVFFAQIPFAFTDFKKNKIAVMDFDQQGESLVSKDMGRIVAEWFITGFVQKGRFDVIERRLLDTVLAEQKLGHTGIMDPDSVAQLGKVLGVKTIVTGTVLNYAGFIEINARLISVDTASIIAAEKVQSSAASGLRDQVMQIVDRISLTFPLEGYVVQRDGISVVIDLGSNVGVRKGIRFVAYKEGRPITHPRTGEVLDVESITTGELEAVDVMERTTRCIVVHEMGQDPVAYGTMVRSTSRDKGGQGPGASTFENAPPSPGPEKKAKEKRDHKHDSTPVPAISL